MRLVCQIWTLALLYKYDRLTFVRPIQFHLNTYADAFTFVGAGLASLYKDCRTFFADETYTVRSLVTKIATLINFNNAL